MSLEWIREHPAVWDADKTRIVGGATAGIFDFGGVEAGAPLAGEWWRVDDDGATAAYAWMDTVWGDAEMLLAVDPAHQRHGVGTFCSTDWRRRPDGEVSTTSTTSSGRATPTRKESPPGSRPAASN